MQKRNMRKDAKDELKKLSDAHRMQIEKKLKQNLVSSDVWKRADRIGITVSKGMEWDTNPIIEAAWQEGKTVAVPKCYPDERKLTFFDFHTYDQLETVYYNLLEPNPNKTDNVNKETIDLLIVPGLLFDQGGFRIGFGGGYYDRFLADFPNRTLSLAADFQVVEKLPSDSYDVPVDSLITEHGMLDQGGM
ncbi:5-formyltetrahydrofolate cyclo-ligase [Lentibacillus halophilus]|uniref:5-formyltetrahydrofolate cyclo-ligase n=1 Tax=Lentibacillus halophilus TaxID=295065 RepID=A0ABP3J5X7_9BACI